MPPWYDILFFFIALRLYLPINKELKENATDCELIPLNLPNQNTTSCFKVNTIVTLDSLLLCLFS